MKLSEDELCMRWSQERARAERAEAENARLRAVVDAARAVASAIGYSSILRRIDVLRAALDAAKGDE